MTIAPNNEADMTMREVNTERERGDREKRPKRGRRVQVLPVYEKIHTLHHVISVRYI
jgi:hypothetical protein